MFPETAVTNLPLFS